MIDWMLTKYLRNYQLLSEAATDLTRTQLRLLAAQSDLGISLWNAVLDWTPPGEGAEGPTRPPEIVAGDLKTLAMQRMQSGFAPPREIYDAQNRGQIDWSSVPDWAKPIDPEMFEGGHEG